MRTLVGGVSLLSEHVSHMNTIMMGIAVPSGSCHDYFTHSGTSHLSEHLHAIACNQGIGPYKLQRIAIEAFTEREETFFLLQAMPEDINILCEWLQHFLCPPEVSNSEFCKEKAIVQEEVLTLECSEIDKIDKAFYANGYKHSPYGLPVGGQSAEIATLEQKDIMHNIRNGHLQEGMTVAIIGDIDGTSYLEAVMQAIERAETPLSAPATPLDKTALQPGHLSIPSDLGVNYFLIGFPAYNRTAKDRINLYAANLFFGNDINSLLFRLLREDKALTYSIKSEYQLFKKAGHLTVKGLASDDNFSEAINVCRRACDEMRDWHVMPEQVEQIKYALKKMLFMNLDEPRNKLLRLLKHELWFSTYFTLQDDLSEVEKVTRDSLFSTAKNIFSKPALLCYGAKR